MPDAIRFLRAHARDIVFAACAACTLWLVLQNMLLFALVSRDHLPHALQLAGTILRAALALAVPMALVTGVVMVAWFRARHHETNAAEAHHE